MNRVVHCFKDGKTKAVTFSYDDGRTEDRQLVDMFNNYGLKGTFHLNAGLMHHENRVSAEEVKALYKGHEVSAHTLTHPTIERSPKEEVIYEVMEDRKALEALVDYPVRGMSYPNGSYSKEIIEVLPHLGIEYARIVGGHFTYQMPKDYHQWQATCHHNRDGLKHAKAFMALNKPQYLYLLYIWGHSYEFTNDDNWDYMEEICKTVSGSDDVWNATNIEIVDYMNAVHGLKFNVARTQVYNPSAMSVWLNVNGITVEVPGGATMVLE